MEDKDFFELYKVFRQDNATYLSSHREHSQQYTTLIIAVFGGMILVVTAAIAQFQENPIPSLFLLIIIALIGPFLNIKLCEKAKDLSNKSYRMFLEHITIQAKLESFIGLDSYEILNGKTKKPFEMDEAIIPARWLEVRNFASSKEFVETRLKEGSNRDAHDTFNLLKNVNIALAVLFFHSFKLCS